jgi:ABC-type arginine/histidine transport system permease subunit
VSVLSQALRMALTGIHREIILNALSLTCGFVGNFCLLLNFTRRIRYIVALPATIIFWYFATGLVGFILPYTGLNSADKTAYWDVCCNESLCPTGSAR